MLKINQICTVDIIDVEPVAGQGVAKLEGFVIFVPFTITGEKVKVQIITLKKSHAKAKIIEIIKPSKHRTKPLCEYYYSCGGCNYQHVAYDHQLEIKALSVKNNINKLSGLDLGDIKITRSDSEFSYRNRIKCTIRKNKMGFINNDYKFIAIDKCAIAHKNINKQLINIAKTDFKKFTHVHLRVDTQNTPVIFLENKKQQEIITTNKSLNFKICGKTFNVSPFSFFQINSSILTKFKKVIEEKLSPQKDEILLDLFCGSGFFSILFADKYNQVFGLELDKKAVKSAKENAEANEITNTNFLSGSVDKNISAIITKNKDKKVSVIIDPPRAGMTKNTIECINASKINQLVYISCYPPTFARDLKLLKEKYTIENVEAVDMFPQTAHTEIICLLKRKS